MSFHEYTLDSLTDGAKGHPTFRIGLIGEHGTPNHDWEACGLCLAMNLLRESFCCAEHAAQHVQENWEFKENREERRANRRKRRPN